MKPKSILITLTLFIFSATMASAAYQVGDRVNDFTLNDADGNPVSLSDFDGLAVVINFWSST